MMEMTSLTSRMPWSKLRARIREFICPELRDRIDFHVTSYRHSHDEAEKAWITVDGERVLTASWYRHQWYGFPRDAKGRLDPDGEMPPDLNRKRDEMHRPQELGDALRAYLDLPIAKAVKSDNPFIVALSVVDRRTGKRTLQAMQIGDDAHSLVRKFYTLRLSTMKPDPLQKQPYD